MCPVTLELNLIFFSNSKSHFSLMCYAGANAE